MDFITMIPKTRKHNDSIMVVVDKLSKESYLIHVKLMYRAINIANIFMKEIFILNGKPKTVFVNQDAKFTSNFWTSLFKGKDTKLNFSTANHPQTNGQIKWVN